MPIYAYRCAACGHSRDVLQKLSDAPLTVCPACGAEQFAKQLTAAGFQLKGSGWYATDFRGSGSGAPAGKPAAGAAEGGGSSASSGGDSAAAAPATPCGGSCACH
jgi:putative FmdB family regulatory protein